MPKSKLIKIFFGLTLSGALLFFVLAASPRREQTENLAQPEAVELPKTSKGAQYQANSAQEVSKLAAQLKPGDTLVLRDGLWNDENLKLSARGTKEQPITLRAATPGKAVFGGTSKIVIEGEYLVVSGLLMKNTAAPGDSIALNGDHCRLTQSAIVGGTSKFFIHLRGTQNQVDHCYFAGKTSDSPTMQIEAEERPNNHLIEWNHFGPRPVLGKNGGETIRIGYSQQSMHNSRTLVERNLFDRCDGEIEVISNKSCENVYRANTFYESAGMLTLRHGNRCLVDGNFFIGNNKKDSGGVRIIGEDHVVVNNYIEGVTRGAFWITSGVPDSPLNGYFQAKNATIAFNTVVDSSGPYLDLDNGFGASGRTLRPQDIVIANNLLASPKSDEMIKGAAGEDFDWKGNLASKASANVSDKGLIIVPNLGLKRAADGLWRPQEDSPARKAAQGDSPRPPTDVDGQARPEITDVGCDQLSDAPAKYRPLKAADTGPSWMPRN